MKKHLFSDSVSKGFLLVTFNHPVSNYADIQSYAYIPVHIFFSSTKACALTSPAFHICCDNRDSKNRNKQINMNAVSFCI